MDDGEDVPGELVDAIDEYAEFYPFDADDIGVEVVDDFATNPGAGIIDLYLFAPCDIDIVVFCIDHRNLFGK